MATKKNQPDSMLLARPTAAGILLGAQQMNRAAQAPKPEPAAKVKTRPNCETGTRPHFYETLMHDAVRYLKLRNFVWTTIRGDLVMGVAPQEVDDSVIAVLRSYGAALAYECQNHPQTYRAAIILASVAEGVPTDCMEEDALWRQQWYEKDRR